MTATEVPILVPDDPGLRAEPVWIGHRRWVNITLRVAIFVVGVVLLYLFVSVLSSTDGVIRVVGVIAALAFMFRGIDGTAKAIFGRRFDTGLWLSALWLGALVLAAIFADLLPLGNYQDAKKSINSPGYAHPDLFSNHPLGTNDFGLDLFARSIYGARESLLTCTVAALAGLVVGCALGIPAAYYRGWFERVVGVLTDVVLSIPALLMLFAVITILGTAKSVPQAVMKVGGALAIIAVPVMTRLARANSLPFIQRDFVLVSHAIGKRDRRIIVRELLPNVLPSLISFLLILIAQFIVAEGALAYLGLGLQPPAPSWGNMISEGGLQTLRQYPFVPLVPGMFMLITVYTLNRVGQKLRVVWVGA
jgi:peptide/nickel transport system permease protein